MAKKRIFKEGERVGNLEIIEDCGVDFSRHHYYMCRCLICNEKVRIIREKLVNHPNPACKRCAKKIDYTGRQISGYTVLYDTRKRNSGRNAIWVCRCNRCARTIEAPTNKIIIGAIGICECCKMKLV